MITMKRKIVVLLAAACVTVSGRISAAEATTTNRKITSADEIVYERGDIVSLFVKKGFATLIELPEGEQAVIPICADCKQIGGEGKVEPDARGHWVVEAVPDSNLVSVMAWFPNVKTDVHILTKSGRVYSFSLAEITLQPQAQPDMRVRIVAVQSASALPEPIKPPVIAMPCIAPHDSSPVETQMTQEGERKRVEASLQHVYRWKENKKATQSFGMRSIYLLDGFTTIEANPKEAPALYEVKDGKDSLIQYSFRDGKYIATKEVDQGYLRIGKSKLTFYRKDSRHG